MADRHAEPDTHGDRTGRPASAAAAADALQNEARRTGARCRDRAAQIHRGRAPRAAGATVSASGDAHDDAGRIGVATVSAPTANALNQGSGTLIAGGEDRAIAVGLNIAAQPAVAARATADIHQALTHVGRACAPAHGVRENAERVFACGRNVAVVMDRDGQLSGVAAPAAVAAVARPRARCPTVAARAANHGYANAHRAQAQRGNAAGVGHRGPARRAAIAAGEAAPRHTAPAIAATPPKAVHGNARRIGTVGRDGGAIGHRHLPRVAAIRALHVCAHARRAAAADRARQHAHLAIAVGRHRAVCDRDRDVARVAAPSGEHVTALRIVHAKAALSAQRLSANRRTAVVANARRRDAGPAAHHHAGVSGVAAHPGVQAGRRPAKRRNRARLTIAANRLRRQAVSHGCHRAAVDRQPCEIAVAAVAIAVPAVAPKAAIAALRDHRHAGAVADDRAVDQPKVDDTAEAAVATPVIATVVVVVGVAVAAVAAAHIDGHPGGAVGRTNVQAGDRALDVDLSGRTVIAVVVMAAPARGTAIVEKQRPRGLRERRTGEHDACDAAKRLQAKRYRHLR